MNIFVVHANPVIAAQQLCDQHVCKMPTEGVQILCTAHELQRRRRIADYVSRMMKLPDNDLRRAKIDVYNKNIERLKNYHKMPMKPVRSLDHQQHPVIRWVQKDPANLHWLLQHTRALFEEYELRFHRTHGSFSKFEQALEVKHAFAWRFASKRQRLAPRRREHWPKLYAQMHFCQAMPLDYQLSPNTTAKTVAAYRRFYIEDKAEFARWTNGRPPPNWWPFSTSQPPHDTLKPCPSETAATSAFVNL
jgi:hypothetical protein